MNKEEKDPSKFASGGVKYLVAEPFGMVYLGLDGRVHTIYGCPLPKLRELAGLMDVLWREINQAIADNPLTTIPEVFHKNTFFQQVCIKCLEICQIDPRTVDLTMMSNMLFPFEFEGKVADGLIMQLNFPKDSSPSSGAIKQGQAASAKASSNWNELLASLWISTKNLSDAVEVSNQVPWNQLAPTMVSRNEAYADPAEREKKEAMRQYAELVQTNNINLDLDVDPDDPDSLAAMGFSEL